MNDTAIQKENEIYAAIKLIEHLYKSGQLPEYIYRNICKEYSGYIDKAA